MSRQSIQSQIELYLNPLMHYLYFEHFFAPAEGTNELNFSLEQPENIEALDKAIKEVIREPLIEEILSALYETNQKLRANAGKVQKLQLNLDSNQTG